MTISKTRGLLAFIVLACTLAGCGAQDKPQEQPGSAVEEPTSSASPSPEPTAVVNEREATIYLTDAELLETVERTVKLAYDSESDLIKAAIAALQKDDGENALSLWKPIEIKSAELAEGQVTLDIHIPDEARLGAPGELLAIETLQKTLFQFEFVKSIDILIDGEAAESLMGHVDLEHPMKKE
ncbi:GerMN domain-containing protein [Paenibacillus prosopidis]|uniref:Sporulation and spore germination protein n=1 Tax=Paenibacillus prosopidis TaxID=630520 RepID=A0A368WC85_9BACL|nr:GerMN domain-containing protein [Paenibacillus prosopidis]RCW51047.1 sporulation and spore germination protein [Paenibacillus prosopidis]